MTTRVSNLVVRFIADTSRFNPASKVAQQNQAIAASNRNLLLSGAGPGTRISQRQAFEMQQARLMAPAVQRAQADVARRQEAARGTPYQSPWTTPGPHATTRGRAITALPSGPGATAGAAFGSRAGTIADLAVVGGLLPEGLGGGLAAGAIGAIGAGLAIGALSKAAISASRSLGTVASVKLDAAFFTLKRQTTLLLAEIGDSLLPVITQMTEGLTNVVKWLRLWTGTDEPRDAYLSTRRRYGRDASGAIVPVGDAGAGPGDRTPREQEVYDWSRRLFADPGSLAEKAIRFGFQAREQTDKLREHSVLNFPFPGEGPEDVKGTSLAERSYNFEIPFLKKLFGMQHGGVVHPRPGGTLARLGEGGEPEAVLPLRYLATMMGGRGGGGMMNDGGQSQKNLADLFMSALEQSQQLRPLWQPEEDVIDPDRIADGGIGAGGYLTFITKTAYDALTTNAKAEKIYAVFSS